MFCWTDNTLWNVPHIQIKCEEYYVEYLLVPQNIVMALNNTMFLTQPNVPY